MGCGEVIQIHIHKGEDRKKHIILVYKGGSDERGYEYRTLIVPWNRDTQFIGRESTISFNPSQTMDYVELAHSVTTIPDYCMTYSGPCLQYRDNTIAEVLKGFSPKSAATDASNNPSRIIETYRDCALIGAIEYCLKTSRTFFTDYKGVKMMCVNDCGGPVISETQALATILISRIGIDSIDGNHLAYLVVSKVHFVSAVLNRMTASPIPPEVQNADGDIYIVRSFSQPLLVSADGSMRRKVEAYKFGKLSLPNGRLQMTQQTPCSLSVPAYLELGVGAVLLEESSNGSFKLLCFWPNTRYDGKAIGLSSYSLIDGGTITLNCSHVAVEYLEKSGNLLRAPFEQPTSLATILDEDTPEGVPIPCIKVIASNKTLIPQSGDRMPVSKAMKTLFSSHGIGLPSPDKTLAFCISDCNDPDLRSQLVVESGLSMAYPIIPFVTASYLTLYNVFVKYCESGPIILLTSASQWSGPEPVPLSKITVNKPVASESSNNAPTITVALTAKAPVKYLYELSSMKREAAFSITCRFHRLSSFSIRYVCNMCSETISNGSCPSHGVTPLWNRRLLEYFCFTVADVTWEADLIIRDSSQLVECGFITQGNVDKLHLAAQNAEVTFRASRPLSTGSIVTPIIDNLPPLEARFFQSYRLQCTLVPQSRPLTIQKFVNGVEVPIIAKKTIELVAGSQIEVIEPLSHCRQIIPLLEM